MLRKFVILTVALSLALAIFAGVGAGTASAASGYNPTGSDSPDVGYCYPSGYNRQGWRCGWRLAMAPYNLGDYYNYYGYYGYYGYWGYYNSGYGGIPTNGGIVDYGGRPRFGYYYNYNPYYYPCNPYNWQYCY